MEVASHDVVGDGVRLKVGFGVRVVVVVGEVLVDDDGVCLSSAEQEEINKANAMAVPDNIKKLIEKFFSFIGMEAPGVALRFEVKLRLSLSGFNPRTPSKE